ncbi:hypothetical protein HS041_37080 [Planomonospora sp. ID67723]|uniref:hypothetical protein n=1 Tax=Planomonospora sp. ID67723 TaxID=2738134 RepID=UPI0018C3E361|nr:hypothetical protein [Planomonospora sp. ID67723]MBG0833319.1 hypothetical protein [Planomonospora sp. ID67723]
MGRRPPADGGLTDGPAPLRSPRPRRRLRGPAGTLAVLVVAAVALAPAAACAAPAGTRAMWLWQKADPAAVVRWATAQKVSEIFAYVPPKLSGSERTRLAKLKKGADAAGIRLAALGGTPEWAFDHAAALAWQRTAMGTGLFHAAHVDVEPYHLPAWKTDQAGTAASFAALLAKLRDADPRPLEADVPFWYHTVPSGTRTLADEVLARVDAVTVMSYRDTATGTGSIMEISADMLRRGEQAGRPVRLGAETLDLPDCPHCTFYGQSRQALTAALAEVDAAAAAYPAYAGIAVHDYAAWTALRP